MPCVISCSNFSGKESAIYPEVFYRQSERFCCSVRSAAGPRSDSARRLSLGLNTRITLIMYWTPFSLLSKGINLSKRKRKTHLMPEFHCSCWFAASWRWARQSLRSVQLAQLFETISEKRLFYSKQKFSKIRTSKLNWSVFIMHDLQCFMSVL